MGSTITLDKTFVFIYLKQYHITRMSNFAEYLFTDKQLPFGKLTNLLFENLYVLYLSCSTEMTSGYLIMRVLNFQSYFLIYIAHLIKRTNKQKHLLLFCKHFIKLIYSSKLHTEHYFQMFKIFVDRSVYIVQLSYIKGSGRYRHFLLP